VSQDTKKGTDPPLNVVCNLFINIMMHVIRFKLFFGGYHNVINLGVEPCYLDHMFCGAKKVLWRQEKSLKIRLQRGELFFFVVRELICKN
jgi:hypothetical protein